MEELASCFIPLATINSGSCTSREVNINYPKKSIVTEETQQVFWTKNITRFCMRADFLYQGKLERYLMLDFYHYESHTRKTWGLSNLAKRYPLIAILNTSRRPTRSADKPPVPFISYNKFIIISYNKFIITTELSHIPGWPWLILLISFWYCKRTVWTLGVRGIDRSYYHRFNIVIYVDLYRDLSFCIYICGVIYMKIPKLSWYC